MILITETMNTKNEIHPLIDTLIKYELAVSSLYEAFSANLPEMRSFWSQLVIEEKAHAEVLQKLAEKSLSNQVMINKGRFTIQAVLTSLEYVKKTRDSVSGETTPRQALSIALGIENSIIEHNAFDVFASEFPSVKAEFTALRKHTFEHIERIKSQIQATGSAI